MYDIDSRPGISYGASMFILIGLIGVCAGLGSIVAGGFWVACSGRPLSDLQTFMNTPGQGGCIQGLQAVMALFMFFIPALVTALLLSRDPFRFLGYKGGLTLRLALLSALLIVVAAPVVSAVMDFNRLLPIPSAYAEYFMELEKSYAQQVGVLFRDGDWKALSLTLLVMALCPAVFEETLFRGCLQGILVRWSGRAWLSILATSVVFSAIHFSFYGFLSRILLGILLGYLYHRSGSLLTSIIAHFANNALAVFAMYWYRSQGVPIEKAMEQGFPWWVALASVPLLVILFRTADRWASELRASRTTPEQRALQEKWIA